MKKLNKFLILLTLPFLMASCIVDDEVATSFSEGPRVVGFLNDFESVAYFADLGAIRHDFPVSLIGGANGTAASEDVTVTYEVDLLNSTAVEGVEFDFVNATNSVVIPSGGTFANIPIDINTGNFNPTAKTTLRLIATTTVGGSSVISTLNETFDIIFVGCQSTIDAFSYDVVVSRDDGASWNHGTQTLLLTATNEFKTETTGGWAAGAIAPDQGFNFIDICGDIKVPLQGLAQGFYSNEVTGLTSDGTDGEVLANGDIRIVYQIGFGSGPAVYTNYYTKL